MLAEPGSYEEFWPEYVRAHQDPVNRALHVTGTTVALVSILAGVVTSPYWLLLSPVGGYAFAWVGHFVFERNQPATFRHPLWSLRGDFRMYRLTLLGRMGRELERVQRLPTR